MTHGDPAILVVDDNEDNRYTLTRRLRRQGYENVTVATNGREALDLIGSRAFDLVLLDIMMPEMNGYEVLERLKGDDRLRHLPVIMISALTELDSVVRCIELGAEDYLPKPFNNVLLKARIGASLERKRLHDREAEHLAEIDRQRARADELLHAILPAAAVASSGPTIACRPRRYDDVTVLFGDLVGFTSYCERNPPDEVVARLDRLVAEFEEIAARYRLEKIKTMGDAFMATGQSARAARRPGHGERPLRFRHGRGGAAAIRAPGSSGSASISVPSWQASSGAPNLTSISGAIP